MKKTAIIVTGILLLGVLNAGAQSKAGADYFAGKWSVLFKGTPNGDARMLFLLEQKNDSIAGVAQDTTGAEISKLTDVTLKDNEIAFSFTAQGYNVNLLLTRKDEDHVTGSLMNMFDAEGERRK
ncbi:hypothetical protein SAMN04488505_103119 [Chitinophaga rupis]|uniref:DUF4488 domain-containing protein n=1 Tax=Chitinophaga rupis TaxID=573321 RepID=A0A1H7UVN9_9BACT|nr:hypothetical protein [Chitinophaga rupis]SEM00799.1 hypothetical protein SAMN04488505_103119 [Chitinophaga rupis]